MSFGTHNVAPRRVVFTLCSALAVASLMIAAAWLKRSAPAGSLAESVGERTILSLAIVAMFVPLLALPLPVKYRSSVNSSR